MKNENLNDRELATVLAALRVYQVMFLHSKPEKWKLRLGPTVSEIQEIASNIDRCVPLSTAEIDELADRLNGCQAEPETPFVGPMAASFRGDGPVVCTFKVRDMPTAGKLDRVVSAAFNPSVTVPSATPDPMHRAEFAQMAGRFKPQMLDEQVLIAVPRAAWKVLSAHIIFSTDLEKREGPLNQPLSGAWYNVVEIAPTLKRRMDAADEMRVLVGELADELNHEVKSETVTRARDLLARVP